MYRAGIEQWEIELKRDFGMGFIRSLSSREIWLALDENHEDSRKIDRSSALQMESLSLQDVDAYHRQLFLWGVIRIGNILNLSFDSELRQEVPVRLGVRN